MRKLDHLVRHSAQESQVRSVVVAAKWAGVVVVVVVIMEVASWSLEMCLPGARGLLMVVVMGTAAAL